jgi:hypothetical protein
MSLASILAKLSREESLSDQDWNDVVFFAFVAAEWLYENTRVERTPISTQVHFQPKSTKKKKRKTKKD